MHFLSPCYSKESSTQRLRITEVENMTHRMKMMKPRCFQKWKYVLCSHDSATPSPPLTRGLPRAGFLANVLCKCPSQNVSAGQ